MYSLLATRGAAVAVGLYLSREDLVGSRLGFVGCSNLAVAAGFGVFGEPTVDRMFVSGADVEWPLSLSQSEAARL